MTLPIPEPEPLDRSSPWDEILENHLLQFESALRSGHGSPSTDLSNLQDCPSEVLQELLQLQSCLTLVDQVRRDSRNETSDPQIPRLLAEPPTIPTESRGDSATSQSESFSLEVSASDEEKGISKPSSFFYSDLRIGRFEIGEKLGEGTYGLVYVAHDPQLKRFVALKVPRLDTAFQAGLRERFLREGESAARLTHPNIVTVYEVATEGPVSLIVSEYIPGPNLAAWLAAHDRKVSPHHAAQLVASLADAVAHAHARNVLHRDIKPSNILLAPHPSVNYSSDALNQYQPKLTDFGLAKLLELQDQTQSGAMIGTPAYMPPEQITGRSSEIGPAVDIYALGMVLYELLTGANPHIKTGVNETIHAVMQMNLPLPHRQCPDTPRDLETICLKCLRKEPGQRYASAMDLAEDLRRYLEGRPILARNVSRLEKVIKWCRRYPALTFATSAAFILLIALLVSARAQNAVIREAYETARRNLQLAEERAFTLQQHSYLTDMQQVGYGWYANRTNSVLELLKRYVPQPGETDLRDFLWWYYWNMLHDDSRVIGKHEGGSTSAVCTHSGPGFAFSAGLDGVIKIWSIPEGIQTGELKTATQSPINFLRLSRDDSLLLACANDGTVRVWNLANKTEQTVFRGHQGAVATACFSPDQKIIASGGDDKIVRLWDISTGKELRAIPGHVGSILALTFHPDKDWLFSSSVDGTVRVWHPSTGSSANCEGRLADGQLKAPIPARAKSLEISPDGKYLAAGAAGVWSLENDKFGKLVTAFPEPSSIQFAKWLHDGRLLAARHSAMHVMAPLQDDFDNSGVVLRGHRHSVWDATILPDDRGLLSVSSSGEVRLWSPTSVQPDVCLNQEAVIKTTQLKWRGDYIELTYQSQGKDHGAAVHMPSQKVSLMKAAEQKSGTMPLAISPSGKEILSADGMTAALQRLDGSPLWSKPLPFSASELEFAPQGDLVAVYGDSRCALLSTSTGEIVGDLQAPGLITHLRILKHHPFLVMSCSDQSLQMCDLSQPRKELTQMYRLSPRPPQQRTPTTFAFTPDERILAATLGDGQTILWSFPEFKELTRRSTYGKRLFFLNGDRTLVMQRNGQNDLRLWYWQSDRNILTVKLEPNRLIDFNPDGTQFAVDTDRGIKVYDGKARN